MAVSVFGAVVCQAPGSSLQPAPQRLCVLQALAAPITNCMKLMLVLRKVSFLLSTRWYL